MLGMHFNRKINSPEGRLLSGWFSGTHGRCGNGLAETDTPHTSHKLTLNIILSSEYFYVREDR